MISVKKQIEVEEWKCDYCGKTFGRSDDCWNHEQSCSRLQDVYILRVQLWINGDLTVSVEKLRGVPCKNMQVNVHGNDRMSSVLAEFTTPPIDRKDAERAAKMLGDKSHEWLSQAWRGVGDYMARRVMDEFRNETGRTEQDA